MKAYYKKFILPFKNPAGTSRGILTSKETYVLHIEYKGKIAVGECNLFAGLSYDDVHNYEEKLNWLCNHITLTDKEIQNELSHFPSIQFGWEQAKVHLNNLLEAKDLYFLSEFTEKKKGIKTNGLIWMGNIAYMQQQMEEKLAKNYNCIKLKIGTNWKEEYKLIQKIRVQYSEDILEIRVDANGVFTYEEAEKVLEQLHILKIHSIEQPIKQGNWKQMQNLCKNTPTPIALDEELIGIISKEEKQQLLQYIKPQYIILKPALVGGFLGSEEWMSLAEKLNIKWWITSALESNIGLNALAQWTFTLQNSLPQGLGTGGLFTHNFPAKTEIRGDELWYI